MTRMHEGGEPKSGGQQPPPPTPCAIMRVGRRNNLKIKNKLPHRSGAKRMLCNVAIKRFPLSSHIFIWTWPICFAVTWCPSATSIFLSVSSNGPGIKYETCGVMWHVDPESKIQWVNCELSSEYLLGISSLPDICAIDAYIFWSLSLSPFPNSFWDARLPLSLKRTCFRCFLLSLGGFGHLAMMWSSDPHLKYLRGLRSVCCLSESPAARAFPYPLLSLNFSLCKMVSTSTKSAFCLNNICSFAIFTRTWTVVKI